MDAPDRDLFRTEVWKRALERYSAATQLSVELTGPAGERLSEPLPVTPVFELIDGRGSGLRLFATCARRCLAQPAGAPPVVEKGHNLAVVGTPLILAGKTIGAAVAGYVVTAFPQQRETQRLAFESNVPFGDLWTVLRRQLPLTRERIVMYGELLQTLCDSLLSENHRAQQLAETSAGLAAEAEAKDRFLAVLSHELRTPLTAMLGWARMLREGKLGADASARALDVIERNTKRQAQLIEDLLHVSRIISGKVALDLRPLGLAQVIDTVVENLRPAVETKGLWLELVLDPAVGLVSADPDRFAQVVSNLVSNAIKFTPAGGRVEVRLGQVDRGVELTVTDTGVGIAPDFLPFVFDRFRQADGGTTRAYAGLGLGLAIVRHLVELHGGSVEATSPGEGRGARFTVCLPVLAGAGIWRSEPYAPTAESSTWFDDVPRLDGVRVLIVDDEADARELFTSVLEQHRSEVTAVSSVAEALTLLKRWRPDVLVSDLGMPGEDGYDLVRKLRRLAPNDGGRIPALALTAYAQTEDGRQALAAGFQLHVAKPVEPVVLAMAVAQLAGRT
jgi:signal transduction histidine kinase/CheY-like chemotaxis protein